MAMRPAIPVFGPIAGNGPVLRLVGGLDPAQFDQTISPQPLTEPLAFDQYVGIQLAVSPVTPGRLSVISGNNQNINPGQSSAPLVVQVTDSSGASHHREYGRRVDRISGGRGHTEPDLHHHRFPGKTQTTVTFSPSAVGQVTVKAALTGSNSGISATFTLGDECPDFFADQGLRRFADVHRPGRPSARPWSCRSTAPTASRVVNQSVSFTVTGGADALGELGAHRCHRQGAGHRDGRSHSRRGHGERVHRKRLSDLQPDHQSSRPVAVHQQLL